jgi:hypothetical protein
VRSPGKEIQLTKFVRVSPFETFPELVSTCRALPVPPDMGQT